MIENLPIDMAGRDADKFTVFCRERSNLGTTWIQAVEAASCIEAAEAGLQDCSHNWGMDQSEIRVIGVAAGDIDILHWED